MNNKIRGLFASMVLLAGSAEIVQAQSVRDALNQIEVERYADAGRTLRGLRATMPTAEHYYYSGYLYALTEKPDSARMMFTEAAAKDAKYPLGKVGLGTADILAGNKAGAAPHFAEAIKLSKNKSAEVNFRIGEAYTIFPTNDAPEGIRFLTKAAELDPKRADILVMQGDAYMIPNDGSTAANLYEKATRIAPNYTKAYISLGNIYIRAKSYNEALKKFKEGLAKDSSYTPSYRQLGELYYRANRYPEAVANYRKYISRSDRNVEAMLKFSGFLISTGQHAEAATYLKELEGKTEKPIYYRLSAYNAYEMGDAAGAGQRLNKFLATIDTTKTKIVPNDYIYQGKIAMATTRDTAQGIAYITKAIGLDTAQKEVFKALGDSAFNAKNYKGASTFYRAYTMAKPGASAQDYFKLGQAEYFAKDYKGADGDFATVVEKSKGKSPTAILYRGYVNQQLDPNYERGAAKPHFEQFISVTTDTAQVPLAQQPKFAKQRGLAHAYLAVYYARKQDKKEAEKEANLALKEDGSNKQAQQVLEALKKPAPAPAVVPAAPGKK
jgi:tetratricopeptide (TPR) repeat protein